MRSSTPVSDSPELVAELAAGPSELTRSSPRGLAWRRFKANRLALVSAAFLVVVAVCAAFAPLIDRYPDTLMAFPPLEGPSSEHWFGTDDLGRDLWSRVVHGAGLSLLVGFGSQAIAVTIGLVVGAIAGFSGRYLDATLMRLTDVMLALPAILLALLFLAVFGASTGVVILAIGLGTWPVIARLVRAQVLQAKALPYVDAARAIGCSSRRVLSTHILRNILGPVIVVAAFGVPQAIFTEAVLSFVGLGPPPPNPSWGRLIADSFEYLRVAPHYVLFPALALSLTLLALNFVGDGLRDALDPKGSR